MLVTIGSCVLLSLSPCLPCCDTWGVIEKSEGGFIAPGEEGEVGDLDMVVMRLYVYLCLL